MILLDDTVGGIREKRDGERKEGSEKRDHEVRREDK